ncbi:hypothetical protein GRX03_11210 [Halovenus sp. WSH3]|uniref:Lipoprotein n=1 Tax=Halovenus carboxidivorans TaxID=2692199 RepID=A0A6B0T7I1_9EURY|nr:hypothetical protein [Halovenus carboxidivorans]MXR52166.1 hypothetical protein [Halovenus carboxidivorans]
MKRRTLLAAAGAATTPLIAGCLGDDSPSDGGPSANETEPPANETDGQSREGDGTEGGDGQTTVEGEPLFEDSFSATSQGGFLAVNEAVETRSEAREAGFVLPDGEEELTLEAEVTENGTWESTQAEFPTVRVDEPITTDVSLELPNGLSGTLSDQQMTVAGRVRVVIEETGDQFGFEIEATTGESGSLSGAANFGEEPPTAVLVDNEFVIEEDTGNIFVDDFLGIPAEEPGTNWFEIEIELTGT